MCIVGHSNACGPAAKDSNITVVAQTGQYEKFLTCVKLVRFIAEINLSNIIVMEIFERMLEDKLVSSDNYQKNFFEAGFVGCRCLPERVTIPRTPG